MELAFHHITTQKKWTDLTLDDASHEKINEIKRQLKDYHGAANDKTNRPERGLAILFCGPSNADRHAAAALLGQELGLEVYSIHLAALVSKYLGETEKNLDQLFAQAKDRNWILFFDEADALFGRRTDIKDSKDRYANVEASSLLQRIEDFNGLAILATNMKTNIDAAMIRRFRYIIDFPFPG